MYTFEAIYENTVDGSVRHKTINIEDNLHQTEKDCYLSAMCVAYMSRSFNECLCVLEFISG